MPVTMDQSGFETVHKAADSANLLSSLPTGSIWALIALTLFIFLIWKTRLEDKSNKEWRDIRERQIASDAAGVEVLKRLTDEVVAMKMLITKFLLKE